MVDRVATDTATSTLSTGGGGAGHSDPGTQSVQLERTGPHPSALALSRSEQIKSGPPSSSGVETGREALWESSRIWRGKGSERLTGLQGANEVSASSPCFVTNLDLLEEAADAN